MGKPRTASPEREKIRRELQEAHTRVKGRISSRTRRRRAVLYTVQVLPEEQQEEK